MNWYEVVIVGGIVGVLVAWGLKVNERLKRLEKEAGLRDIDDEEDGERD